MKGVPAIKEADRPRILEWLYTSSDNELNLCGMTRLDFRAIADDAASLPEMPVIRIWRKAVPVHQFRDDALVIYIAVRWDTNEEICRTEPTLFKRARS